MEPQRTGTGGALDKIIEIAAKSSQAFGIIAGGPIAQVGISLVKFLVGQYNANRTAGNPIELPGDDVLIEQFRQTSQRVADRGQSWLGEGRDTGGGS